MQGMKVSKIGAVAITGSLFVFGLALCSCTRWLSMPVLVAWGDAIWYGAPWMVPNGKIVNTEKVGPDWLYVRANY